MHAQADKTADSKEQSVANAVTQKKVESKAPQFVDNRPETVAQRMILGEAANSNNSTPHFTDNRPEAIIQRKLHVAMNHSPQSQRLAQLQSIANEQTSQQKQPIQRKSNNTETSDHGLPANLKSGIENLSGYSMDDVKVHYNSNKPAQLNAHAYAQGTDIHIASGQEKHLSHEAWHVVQQKQGRVKPTMQMKGGINVNDDVGLEREADVMGNKALQMKAEESRAIANSVAPKGINGQQRFTFVDNRNEAIQHVHKKEYNIGFENGVSQSNSATQLRKEGNIYSVDITEEVQEQSGWCYAATTVIMRRALGNEEITQMDVVREYLVRSGEVSAEIIDELPNEIIESEYGDTYGIERVEGYSFKMFSVELVILHLENGIPLVLGWGGHSTVITGYDAEKKMLNVYDPMNGTTSQCPAEWMTEQEVLTVF